MAERSANAYRVHVFLTLMVIGLVGLAAMAIPAFGHGHGALSGHGAAHGVGHAGGAHCGVHGAGHGMSHASAGDGRGVLSQLLPADAARTSAWRFVPSPRAVFSLLALYGAFGNAAMHALHQPLFVATVGAVVPAVLVERLLVRPLWNLVFRLEAPASSPLAQLVSSEARAIVVFRNGKGMVSTVRDGRSVQLVAYLREDQDHVPVRVGDRLSIESVDAAKERVIVSIIQN